MPMRRSVKRRFLGAGFECEACVGFVAGGATVGVTVGVTFGAGVGVATVTGFAGFVGATGVAGVAAFGVA